MTAYVYYYAPDKTDILLDAVQPLFEKLGGAVSSAYFTRHWRFGPHIRIRFRITLPEQERIIIAAVQDVIGGYLRKRPSNVSFDRENLLRQHLVLARLESERGALTPLQPDNSITFTNTFMLGQDSEDEAVQRFLANCYAETTQLAFSMLDAQRSQRESRFDLGFDLMTAAAHALYPSPQRRGIAEGFVSFRSHAEAYLAMIKEGEAVRNHFEREYRRFAPQLVRRLRDAVAALDERRSGRPFVQEWLLLAKPQIDRASDLIATGALVLPAPRRKATGKYGWDDDWVGRSRFHSVINASDRYLSFLFENEWFQKYRIALNLTYLHLNRIGLLPVERYLLCHLVANTVEDIYGVFAQDLAKGFAGTLA